MLASASDGSKSDIITISTRPTNSFAPQFQEFKFDIPAVTQGATSHVRIAPAFFSCSTHDEVGSFRCRVMREYDAFVHHERLNGYRPQQVLPGERNLD